MSKLSSVPKELLEHQLKTDGILFFQNRFTSYLKDVQKCRETNWRTIAQTLCKHLPKTKRAEVVTSMLSGIGSDPDKPLFPDADSYMMTDDSYANSNEFKIMADFNLKYKEFSVYHPEYGTADSLAEYYLTWALPRSSNNIWKAVEVLFYVDYLIRVRGDELSDENKKRLKQSKEQLITDVQEINPDTKRINASFDHREFAKYEDIGPIGDFLQFPFNILFEFMLAVFIYSLLSRTGRMRDYRRRLQQGAYNLLPEGARLQVTGDVQDGSSPLTAYDSRGRRRRHIVIIPYDEGTQLQLDVSRGQSQINPRQMYQVVYRLNGQIFKRITVPGDDQDGRVSLPFIESAIDYARTIEWLERSPDIEILWTETVGNNVPYGFTPEGQVDEFLAQERGDQGLETGFTVTGDTRIVRQDDTTGPIFVPENSVSRGRDIYRRVTQYWSLRQLIHDSMSLTVTNFMLSLGVLGGTGAVTGELARFGQGELATQANRAVTTSALTYILVERQLRPLTREFRTFFMQTTLRDDGSRIQEPQRNLNLGTYNFIRNVTIRPLNIYLTFLLVSGVVYVVPRVALSAGADMVWGTLTNPYILAPLVAYGWAAPTSLLGNAVGGVGTTVMWLRGQRPARGRRTGIRNNRHFRSMTAAIGARAARERHAAVNAMGLNGSLAGGIQNAWAFIDATTQLMTTEFFVGFLMAGGLTIAGFGGLSRMYHQITDITGLPNIEELGGQGFQWNNSPNLRGTPEAEVDLLRIYFFYLHHAYITLSGGALQLLAPSARGWMPRNPWRTEYPLELGADAVRHANNFVIQAVGDRTVSVRLRGGIREGSLLGDALRRQMLQVDTFGRELMRPNQPANLRNLWTEEDRGWFQAVNDAVQQARDVPSIDAAADVQFDEVRNFKDTAFVKDLFKISTSMEDTVQETLDTLMVELKTKVPTNSTTKVVEENYNEYRQKIKDAVVGIIEPEMQRRLRNLSQPERVELAKALTVDS